MNNLLSVINEFGQEVTVNHSEAVIEEYSNKDNEVNYNAEIYEDGKPTGFNTGYTLKGRVDDLETKLKVWNNPVLFAYSLKVDFQSSKNDPDRSLWEGLIEKIRENEEQFFDEHGDWKKELLIDPADLIKSEA